MLKASKHEAGSKIRSRQGPSQTTTLIGRRCKCGDALSRAVLIARSSGKEKKEKLLKSSEALFQTRVAPRFRHIFPTHNGLEKMKKTDQ